MATLTINCSDRRQRMHGFGTEVMNIETPTAAEVAELVNVYGLSYFKLCTFNGPVGADGKPALIWRVPSGQGPAGGQADLCDTPTWVSLLSQYDTRWHMEVDYLGDGGWIYRVNDGASSPFAPGNASSWRASDGSLRVEHYRDFAEWYLRILQAAQAAGITVRTLEVFGEPDVNQPPYQASAPKMTYAQVAAYFAHADGGQYLRQLVKGFDPNIQIVTPAVTSYTTLTSYVSTVQANPTAYAQIDGFSVHDYGPLVGVNDSPWDTGYADGKGFIQSESWDNTDTDTIAGAITHAKRFIATVVTAHASGYIFWNPWRMLAFSDAWVGSDWSHSGIWSPAPSKTRWKRGYAMAHMGRVARPDIYRVGHSIAGVNANTIAAFADDARVGVVIVNDNGYQLDISGTIQGAPLAQSFGTVIRTSATENAVALGAVPITGGAFSISLPPNSIVSMLSVLNLAFSQDAGAVGTASAPVPSLNLGQTVGASGTESAPPPVVAVSAAAPETSRPATAPSPALALLQSVPLMGNAQVAPTPTIKLIHPVSALAPAVAPGPTQRSSLTAATANGTQAAPPPLIALHWGKNFRSAIGSQYRRPLRVWDGHNFVEVSPRLYNGSTF